MNEEGNHEKQIPIVSHKQSNEAGKYPGRVHPEIQAEINAQRRKKLFQKLKNKIENDKLK